MATAMAVPSLAPRPSPRPIAAWSVPGSHLDGKENRPALKQLQQSTSHPRPRRERPCDGCRKRKSKCVLQEHRRCVLCEFHKQPCTFVENAQPRKRKAEEDVKQDSAAPLKKSVAVVGRPPPTPETSSRPSSASKPTPPRSFQPSMKKPFAVDETLSLQRHRHCTYLGQTTVLDPFFMALGSFDAANETESSFGVLRQVSRTEYFSTHADAAVSMPEDEVRALAEIEEVVGDHGPALVDIYFRNIHPSYPIIQKQAFLDRHGHGDRQFNPPLLAAMYLLALNWWHSDPTLSSHPQPNVSRLQQIANASWLVAMQRPKISAVQAGLLLLQRPRSSTWNTTVQLVALAQDIGLHLDCSEWSIPHWERLLRKRLAWALYMQDRWAAVLHGRPSHINSTDWSVPVLTEDDFDETILPDAASSDEEPDAQQAKGRVVFMHMVSLTAIMSEVCDTFYSESAKAEYSRAGRDATKLVLARAKPVQIRLKDWFARLPAECKIDSFTPDQLSSQGHLHLAYFATEISIHRRIVQSLDISSPSSSAPPDQYLLYICRSAAKTRLISALDFVNRLRPEHLDAFWFFASASNFALIGTFGALLLATSPGREEAHFYACRLNEFRWTLGVSAAKAPWIADALEALNATSDLLRHMPEKPSTQEQQAHLPGRGDGEMPALSEHETTPSAMRALPQQLQQGHEEEHDNDDDDDHDDDDHDDDDHDDDGDDDDDMDAQSWSSEDTDEVEPGNTDA